MKRLGSLLNNHLRAYEGLGGPAEQRCWPPLTDVKIPNPFWVWSASFKTKPMPFILMEVLKEKTL